MSGVTYRLSFRDHPEWAIGSTTQPLAVRKAKYLYDARHKCKQTPLYQMIAQVGKDGFALTEIDQVYFTDKRTLLQREKALILEHRDDFDDPLCLNTVSPITSREERAASQAKLDAARDKEAARQRAREYHARNRDLILPKMRAKAKEQATQRKAYRERNRDRLLQARRALRKRKKDALTADGSGQQ